MRKRSCGTCLFLLSIFKASSVFSQLQRAELVSVVSEDAEDPSSSSAVNTSRLWQMDGSEQKCQVKEGAAFPQDKGWGLRRVSDT